MNILFVCLGNICRSPMAEGILKRLYSESGTTGLVDSAGVMDWNQGSGADQRAIQVALENGVDIRLHRARQIRTSDFSRFDMIIGMDSQNDRALRKLLPTNCQTKVLKMTSFDDSLLASDIEDPYHGSMKDFRDTFNLLDGLCNRIMKELEQ